MKTKFFLTLTTACLFLARSNGQSFTQTETDSSKMETISFGYPLFPNDNHYTIKIGQRMEYVFESYVSVGRDFSCHTISADILKFVGRVPIQEELDASEDGDGGDDKIEKFVFEGIKEGTSILVISELFRFEVQQEMFFTITVEK